MPDPRDTFSIERKDGRALVTKHSAGNIAVTVECDDTRAAISKTKREIQAKLIALDAAGAGSTPRHANDVGPSSTSGEPVDA